MDVYLTKNSHTNFAACACLSSAAAPARRLRACTVWCSPTPAVGRRPTRADYGAPSASTPAPAVNGGTAHGICWYDWVCVTAAAAAVVTGADRNIILATTTAAKRPTKPTGTPLRAAGAKRVAQGSTAGAAKFSAPATGLFAGREHVFGALSFTPVKGAAAKKLVQARILADHNT
jgi:hypothetical protein